MGRLRDVILVEHKQRQALKELMKKSMQEMEDMAKTAQERDKMILDNLMQRVNSKYPESNYTRVWACEGGIGMSREEFGPSTYFTWEEAENEMEGGITLYG
jgi:hypothetical protein